MDVECKMYLSHSNDGNCIFSLQRTDNVAAHRVQDDFYSLLRAKLGFPANTTVAALLSTMRARVGSFSDRITPERRAEIEALAARAGLRYEEVPYIAILLEGTVRQLVNLELDISEFLLRYTMQHPWGRFLLGFWPEKLTLGVAWIFCSCVFDTGTGRCWKAVDYTVRFLLVGPMSALLHIVYLALKRWWVFVQPLTQGQRWI